VFEEMRGWLSLFIYTSFALMEFELMLSINELWWIVMNIFWCKIYGLNLGQIIISELRVVGGSMT